MCKELCDHRHRDVNPVFKYESCSSMRKHLCVFGMMGERVCVWIRISVSKDILFSHAQSTCASDIYAYYIFKSGDVPVCWYENRTTRLYSSVLPTSNYFPPRRIIALRFHAPTDSDRLEANMASTEKLKCS